MILVPCSIGLVKRPLSTVTPHGVRCPRRDGLFAEGFAGWTDGTGHIPQAVRRIFWVIDAGLWRLRSVQAQADYEITPDAIGKGRNRILHARIVGEGTAVGAESVEKIIDIDKAGNRLTGGRELIGQVQISLPIG
jgi:hypothetical protein